MVNLDSKTYFEFDEISSRILTDPYPLYSELLKIEGPVFVRSKDITAPPILLVSHYKDVMNFLTLSNEISHNPKYLDLVSPKNFSDYYMMNIDGKDHIILRKIVSYYLSKERLKLIEIQTSNYIAKLLEEIDYCNEVDLIKKIAEAVPLAVLGFILNISNMDSLRNIRQWGLEIAPFADTFLTGTPFLIPINSSESTKIIGEFCLNLIEERKKNLSDDLVSHLIEECRQKNISDEVMLGNLISLLFASHDSTVNMIGNGLYLLLEYPDQLNALIRDPLLLEQCVNEILRFESPVQRATYRITKIDLKMGDMNIPAKTQVILFLAAANRDHRVFEDPSHFDISRKHNPHIAFGHGLHNCIGKSLSMMEARLLFPKVMKYLTQVKLVKDKPNWKKLSIFRGQEDLWVEKISSSKDKYLYEL